MWVKIANLRGPSGADGRPIEIDKDSGSLLWRHVGDKQWKELVGIDELRGKDGVSITDVFLNRDGELIMRNSAGKIKNLGRVKGKDGEDGKDGENSQPVVVGSGLALGGGADDILIKNKQDVTLAGSTQWYSFATFFSEKFGNTKGDILTYNGTTWEELAIGTNRQYITPNDSITGGISWETKGFSYLTDENGNVLTDENNNALEGLDGIDAALLVNIQADYTNSFLFMGG